MLSTKKEKADVAIVKSDEVGFKGKILSGINMMILS